jgi:DNA ligase-1
MAPFRPLLAYDATKQPLTFPLYASAKIDGIRCLITWGGPVTRTLKPIPNHFIRKSLSALPYGLDGELIVGTSFQQSTSGIMSQEGEPDFTYWVFDHFDLAGDRDFIYRLEGLVQILTKFLDKNPQFRNIVRLLPHRLLGNQQELDLFEEECLYQGFEGVMVRSPTGKYKHGRSTANERILGKIKRFADREATVLGITPLFRNQNPAQLNALNLTERSHDASGKVETNLLGSLVVRDPGFASTFEIGSGFTSAQRKRLFDNPPLGQIVKYKYLPHGTVEKPRHPIFLGFRHPSDVSIGETP